MKRIRLQSLQGQVLASTRSRTCSTKATTTMPMRTITRPTTTVFQATQQTTASTKLSPLSTPSLHGRRWQSTNAPAVEIDDVEGAVDPTSLPLPSPPPERALSSAKLAALHARLSLSTKIPLQTLARTLIDPSADADNRFNNADLAFVGSSLLQYHASEWLISHYPRLPMAILFAAMKGLVGPPALHQVARAWGVEAAAAPGEEVDPGLLQFSASHPTYHMNKHGYVRGEAKEIEKYKWRRGMSSRVLYDDAFGDVLPTRKQIRVAASANSEVSDHKNTMGKELVIFNPAENAHANFVRATIGTIYLYCGRDAAKNFVKSYILSRWIDLSNLFSFKQPTRELARLCARENFDAPIARMLSETGRMSRTPVFVVGIFSGADKLGEGVGPSLDSARTAASMNALKSWYLYSPGNHAPVPSDTFADDAAPWEPIYVDIGEIV